MHNTIRYNQRHYRYTDHGINLEKTNLITSCYHAIKVKSLNIAST